MGSRYHHAIAWPVAPLQLICKFFSFHIILPEAFTLKVPSSFEVPFLCLFAWFLVSQLHRQRNL